MSLVSSIQSIEVNPLYKKGNEEEMHLQESSVVTGGLE